VETEGKAGGHAVQDGNQCRAVGFAGGQESKQRGLPPAHKTAPIMIPPRKTVKGRREARGLRPETAFEYSF